MSTPTTLRYAASVDNADTGFALSDPELLARCDGARAGQNLAEFVSAHELSTSFGLQRIDATLRFDSKAERLWMVLEVSSREPVSREARAELVGVLERILDRWPYEFALPEPHWQAHFQLRPHEEAPAPQLEALHAIEAEWPTLSYERFSALSDDALTQALARIRPLEPFLRASKLPVARHVRAVLAALESQRQSRVAAKLPVEGDDFI